MDAAGRAFLGGLDDVGEFGALRIHHHGQLLLVVDEGLRCQRGAFVTGRALRRVDPDRLVVTAAGSRSRRVASASALRPYGNCYIAARWRHARPPAPALR
jgi:hypothetical protein